MIFKAFRLFISTCLCIGLFTLSLGYAAGDDADAMIETVKGVIAAEKENAPSDSAFKFNPGVEALKTGANKAFGEDSAAAKYFRGSKNKNLNKLGETIPEKTLDGLVESHIYPEAANVEEYEKKVKSKQKTLEKIKKKNQANQALSDALEKDKNRHARNLQNLAEQEVNASAFEKKRIKKQIKTETRRFNSASAAQKRVNRRIAQSGMTKATKELTAFEKKLLNARKSASTLRNAMARKASFDKKNLVVGAVLTAVSSQLEENALAEKEGRMPRATNVMWNFAKNMSGYSTVLGVMESAELAKLEAFVEAAEFYKKNGFDINDPEVQAKIEASVRRAVQKKYIYEGAKLAPVVGDLINIKEAAEAGTDAIVAIEELSYIRASNKQEQFQMGLTTAIKADAKVTEMDKIVEQTNQLVASLGKLKAQLLNMEKAASGNREKVTQAIRTLEAYNEQAQALQNPAVASALDEANTDALLARLNAIKASADEQIGNMTRVKSEHTSGDLTPQGVANQTKFIGDLLQPSVDDYTNLQPTLSGIEAIGKGTELAAQVPQALELLRQGKGVMQKEAQRTDELYTTYREQAGNLKELSDRFKTLKQELAKNQAFLDTSTNLEQVHRERIRAAVARSRDIDINKNAITKAIEDARNLRNSAEMVSALAALDKVPPVGDTSQVNALFGKAQQTWGKLSVANLAAADSLQKAQDLLNELVALAGDAELVEDSATPEIREEEDQKEYVRAGLFKGTNWLTITPNEIERRLKNRTADGDWANKDFFGFQTFGFPKGVKTYEHCKQVKDEYCPHFDTLYRVLEEGTARWQVNNTSGKGPYWIAYDGPRVNPDFMHNSNRTSTHFKLDNYSSYEHASTYNPKIPSLTKQVIPISPTHANEGSVIKTQSKGKNVTHTYTKVYMRQGPLVISAGIDNENIDCQMKEQNANGYTFAPMFSSSMVSEVPDYISDVYDSNFIERCVYWINNQEIPVIELLDRLLAEVEPILDRTRKRFYFSDIDFSNISIDGAPLDKEKSYNTILKPMKNSRLKFQRRWTGVRDGNVKVDFYHDYEVRMEMDYSIGDRSWQQVMDKFDEELTNKYQGNMEGSYQKEDPVEINIQGADISLMSSFKDQNVWDNFTRFVYNEHLYFRIANISVAISARVGSNEEGTYTRAIARAIASKILSTRRGW